MSLAAAGLSSSHLLPYGFIVWLSFGAFLAGWGGLPVLASPTIPIELTAASSSIPTAAANLIPARVDSTQNLINAHDFHNHPAHLAQIVVDSPSKPDIPLHHHAASSPTSIGALSPGTPASLASSGTNLPMKHANIPSGSGMRAACEANQYKERPRSAPASPIGASLRSVPDTTETPSNPRTHVLLPADEGLASSISQHNVSGDVERVEHDGQSGGDHPITREEMSHYHPEAEERPGAQPASEEPPAASWDAGRDTPVALEHPPTPASEGPPPSADYPPDRRVPDQGLPSVPGTTTPHFYATNHHPSSASAHWPRPLYQLHALDYWAPIYQLFRQFVYLPVPDGAPLAPAMPPGYHQSLADPKSSHPTALPYYGAESSRRIPPDTNSARILHERIAPKTFPYKTSKKNTVKKWRARPTVSGQQQAEDHADSPKDSHAEQESAEISAQPMHPREYKHPSRSFAEIVKKGPDSAPESDDHLAKRLRGKSDGELEGKMPPAFTSDPDKEKQGSAAGDPQADLEMSPSTTPTDSGNWAADSAPTLGSSSDALLQSDHTDNSRKKSGITTARRASRTRTRSSRLGPLRAPNPVLPHQRASTSGERQGEEVDHPTTLDPANMSDQPNPKSQSKTTLKDSSLSEDENSALPKHASGSQITYPRSPSHESSTILQDGAVMATEKVIPMDPRSREKTLTPPQSVPQDTSKLIPSSNIVLREKREGMNTEEKKSLMVKNRAGRVHGAHQKYTKGDKAGTSVSPLSPQNTFFILNEIDKEIPRQELSRSRKQHAHINEPRISSKEMQETRKVDDSEPNNNNLEDHTFSEEKNSQLGLVRGLMQGMWDKLTRFQLPEMPFQGLTSSTKQLIQSLPTYLPAIPRPQTDLLGNVIGKFRSRSEETSRTELKIDDQLPGNFQTSNIKKLTEKKKLVKGKDVLKIKNLLGNHPVTIDTVDPESSKENLNHQGLKEPFESRAQVQEEKPSYVLDYMKKNPGAKKAELDLLSCLGNLLKADSIGGYVAIEVPPLALSLLNQYSEQLQSKQLKWLVNRIGDIEGHRRLISFQRQMNQMIILIKWNERKHILAQFFDDISGLERILKISTSWPNFYASRPNDLKLLSRFKNHIPLQKFLKEIMGEEELDFRMSTFELMAKRKYPYKLLSEESLKESYKQGLNTKLIISIGDALFFGGSDVYGTVAGDTPSYMQSFLCLWRIWGRKEFGPWAYSAEKSWLLSNPQMEQQYMNRYNYLKQTWKYLKVSYPEILKALPDLEEKLKPHNKLGSNRLMKESKMQMWWNLADLIDWQEAHLDIHSMWMIGCELNIPQARDVTPNLEVLKNVLKNKKSLSLEMKGKIENWFLLNSFSPYDHPPHINRKTSALQEIISDFKFLFSSFNKK